ncbi:MAG: PAS domain-containing protein [Deltaproteobacteria bacterium]|nr:PAS domain-containing protein [Deltaproteobacteria bacterium]
MTKQRKKTIRWPVAGDGDPSHPLLDHLMLAAESASQPMGLCDPAGKHFYANPAFGRLFGVSTGKKDDRGLSQSLYADPAMGRSALARALAEGSFCGEMRMRAGDKGDLLVVVRLQPLYDENGSVLAVLCLYTDLSRQGAAETGGGEDHRLKNRELEEVNRALKTLLAQHRESHQEFQQRILANVEDLVLPYVRRLKETPLEVDQRVYVNVVEANLTELVAPFMRRIGSMHADLSPREIEVANLVRMGATSKEIANILNISKRAVEFHRDSLRKKLGLKKTKRNLRAYLVSLE